VAGSVTEPLSKAAERAQRLLFSPFDFTKWLHLGFIAFIAYLGESGGSVQIPNFPSTGSSPSTPGFGGIATEIEEGLRWIRTNQSLVIWIAIASVVVITVLGLALIWLTSRGKLMFVDAVVHDRFAVSEPWHRLKAIAFSLCKFRVLLMLVGWAVTLPIVGAAIFAALPDLRAWRFETHAMLGIVISFVGLLLVGAPLTIAALLLEDFVVPTMALRNLECVPAWRVVRTEVLRGNGGTIVLLYVMKAGLALGIGMLTAIVTCVTCCLAALPYVSSVVFLPVHVFSRSYSLYFLEELGQKVFPDTRPPPAWYEGRFQPR
jgi:hypothetical protein